MVSVVHTPKVTVRLQEVNVHPLFDEYVDTGSTQESVRDSVAMPLENHFPAFPQLLNHWSSSWYFLSYSFYFLCSTHFGYFIYISLMIANKPIK